MRYVILSLCFEFGLKLNCNCKKFSMRIRNVLGQWLGARVLADPGGVRGTRPKGPDSFISTYNIFET